MKYTKYSISKWSTQHNINSDKIEFLPILFTQTVIIWNINRNVIWNRKKKVSVCGFEPRSFHTWGGYLTIRATDGTVSTAQLRNGVCYIYCVLYICCEFVAIHQPRLAHTVGIYTNNHHWFRVLCLCVVWSVCYGYGTSWTFIQIYVFFAEQKCACNGLRLSDFMHAIFFIFRCVLSWVVNGVWF